MMLPVERRRGYCKFCCNRGYVQRRPLWKRQHHKLVRAAQMLRGDLVVCPYCKENKDAQLQR